MQAINVIVHYPSDDEAKQALSGIVSDVHAQTVMEIVRKLPCPTEQKLSLIDAVIAIYSKKDGS